MDIVNILGNDIQSALNSDFPLHGTDANLQQGALFLKDLPNLFSAESSGQIIDLTSGGSDLGTNIKEAFDLGSFVNNIENDISKGVSSAKNAIAGDINKGVNATKALNPYTKIDSLNKELSAETRMYNNELSKFNQEQALQKKTQNELNNETDKYNAEVALQKKTQDELDNLKALMKKEAAELDAVNKYTDSNDKNINATLDVIDKSLDSNPSLSSYKSDSSLMHSSNINLNNYKESDPLFQKYEAILEKYDKLINVTGVKCQLPTQSNSDNTKPQIDNNSCMELKQLEVELSTISKEISNKINTLTGEETETLNLWQKSFSNVQNMLTSYQRYMKNAVEQNSTNFNNIMGQQESEKLKLNAHYYHYFAWAIAAVAIISITIHFLNYDDNKPMNLIVMIVILIAFAFIVKAMYNSFF